MTNLSTKLLHTVFIFSSLLPLPICRQNKQSGPNPKYQGSQNVMDEGQALLNIMAIISRSFAYLAYEFLNLPPGGIVFRLHRLTYHFLGKLAVSGARIVLAVIRHRFWFLLRTSNMV